MNNEGTARGAGRLVLSLFPGADFLGLAFELEGFCVVQGPDLKWGRDVREFHPPAGRFDGVIGGPPCQTHSTMKHLALKGNGVPAGEKHGDQIPEFERIVAEAAPTWFVMENVMGAPVPVVAGYGTRSVAVDHVAVGGDTSRRRRFTCGMRDSAGDVCEFAPESLALWRPDPVPTVLAGHGPALGQRVRGIQGRSWQEGARLQGLPADVIARLEADAPYTVHGLKSLVGNAVPVPMGRAVARCGEARLGAQGGGGMTADLVERIRRALEKVRHSPGYDCGRSLGASHRHLSAYVLPCTCPRDEEIAERVAAAIGESWRGHHGPDWAAALRVLEGER